MNAYINTLVKYFNAKDIEIKSKYILEAMRAIPQDSLGRNKLSANKKSGLSGLKRTKQIEKINVKELT